MRMSAEDFMNRNAEATQRDANSWSCRQIEPRLRFIRVMARAKRRDYPRFKAYHLTQGGGGVSWEYMAAIGTGSPIFIDHISTDGCREINSEVYKCILSAHGQVQVNALKLTGWQFILQQDGDAKQTH